MPTRLTATEPSMAAATTATVADEVRRGWRRNHLATRSTRLSSGA